MIISEIIFLTLLAVSIGFFVKSIRRIMRNIRLGRELVINDRPAERWMTMARVALGQSKMEIGRAHV